MSKLTDKKELDSFLRDFESLGIKEKEGLVYLALLGKNQVGSSKIVAATGLHGQFVYDALASLEEKGLVHHSIIRGRKKFSANPPSRIKTLVEQKKFIADNVVSRLNELGNEEHLQDFEIYQGKESFISHEFDLLENSKEGDYLDIIAGDSMTYYQNVLGPKLTKEYENTLVRKKIFFRIICPSEQADSVKEAAKIYVNCDYRIMPNMEVGLVNTIVRPQSITFHTYGTPLLAYTVRNEAVARTYKQFFDSLWNMCGK